MWWVSFFCPYSPPGLTWRPVSSSKCKQYSMSGSISLSWEDRNTDIYSIKFAFKAQTCLGTLKGQFLEFLIFCLCVFAMSCKWPPKCYLFFVKWHLSVDFRFSNVSYDFLINVHYFKLFLLRGLSTGSQFTSHVLGAFW